MFAQLKSLFTGWPANVPNYYPELTDLEVAEFLSQQEFDRIKKFRCVYILPFADMEADNDEIAMGIALSHQLIRNLMLLNDISIHGNEDTSRVTGERAVDLSEEVKDLCVTGLAKQEGSTWTLAYRVLDGGTVVADGRVNENDFHLFILACSKSVARAIGSGGQLTDPDGWSVGQAPSARALTDYGHLVYDFDPRDIRRKTAAAIALMKAEPSFALPAWQMDKEVPQTRRWLLEALKRDPLNAQSCFSAFCAFSSGGRHERHAMQFCRKAIEHSPGHGKAHMCAPHDAHPDAYMLKHSHLGYRLLNGNTFAITNYINNMKKYGAPAEDLLRLAREGIDAGPNDPGNYHHAINLLTGLQEWESALEVAYDLQGLFEPEMNERAMYCLRQSPETIRMLKNGEYDPVRDTRSLIQQLRQRVPN